MLRRKSVWVIALLGSFALFGCGEPGEENEDQAEIAALETERSKADFWSGYVKVSTNQTGYPTTEEIKVAIANKFNYTSIYLAGCNATVLQQKVGQSWQDLPPEKLCLWEGFAVRIKPQATGADLYGPKAPGKYRVKVPFKIFCSANKTYAGCASMERVVFSPAFTVKSTGGCTKDADCAAGQFCKFKDGECLLPTFNILQGTCTAKPEACIEIYGPVCGCDGKSYGNPCFADMAGTSVAKKGLCQQDCPLLAPPGPGFCPNGTIVPNVDPVTGCTTGFSCKCNPVNCPIWCDYGYETDDFGCEICSCVDPFACQQNADCTVAKADCCGCQMGGSSVAVNKQYKELVEPTPEECTLGGHPIMCLAVYLCFGQPVCVGGKCVLQ